MSCPPRTFCYMALLLLLSWARLLAAQVLETTPSWCEGQPRPVYSTLTRLPSPTPWYEVYQVGDGVYALYEPHQWEEEISFLILGEKKALLLDTGMGIAQIRPVVASLTTLPVMVLNTHVHPDHVGGNWEFEDVLGIDVAATHRAEQGFDHAARAWELAPDHLCGSLPEGFDSTSYSVRAFTVRRYAADGDRLDLGGRHLRVLTTPGHATSAVSLLEEEHGLLFTGDTFYEGPIYVLGQDANWVAYRHSVARLAGLGSQVQRILASHNSAVSPVSYLTALNEAVRAIHEHRVQPSDAHDNTVVFRFNGFSLQIPDSAEAH